LATGKGENGQQKRGGKSFFKAKDLLSGGRKLNALLWIGERGREVAYLLMPVESGEKEEKSFITVKKKAAQSAFGRLQEERREGDSSEEGKKFSRPNETRKGGESSIEDRRGREGRESGNGREKIDTRGRRKKGSFRDYA